MLRKATGFCLAVSVIALIAASHSHTAFAQNTRAANPPIGPARTDAVELALKIKKPFTVVAVGDMLQLEPFAKYDDPDIQYLLDIMRHADMTFANSEDTIVDYDTFRGPISHLEAPATVADDWANMGIKMITKANNQTWDDGEEGVWQEFRLLDKVGIGHTGVDYNQAEARLARFYETPKGSAAFVGVYADSGINQGGRQPAVSVTPDQLKQLRAIRDSIVARRNEVGNPIDIPSDPSNEVSVFGIQFKTGPAAEPVAAGGGGGGRPDRRGVITSKANTLRLTTYNGVTAAQLAQLRAIAGASGQSSGNTLTAWGQNFWVAPGPGEFHYAMNADDERDIMREVKSGKQIGDFEAVTTHWHQNRVAFQQYSFDHYPADYEIQFAHDAVDKGADMFFGHGVHSIKGVEIYKGKPIFYGVSNFVIQVQKFRSWRDRADAPPPNMTDSEDNTRTWGWMQQPANFEALLTTSHYENGKLTEVRIYPVDLGGPERPGSQVGLPKKPSTQKANEILAHVQEYSKPFGTKISIEDGVGIIKLP